MLDYWELNGTNVGDGNEPWINSITVMMNASYVLTCVYFLIPPLKFSISPLATPVEHGSFVNFVANVSGGPPPYHYQWYLNDTRVPYENSDHWNFTPPTEGFYRVFFKIRDTWSSTVDWKESETAMVTVESTVPEFSSVTSSLLLLVTSLLIALCRNRFHRTKISPSQK